MSEIKTIWYISDDFKIKSFKYHDRQETYQEEGGYFLFIYRIGFKRNKYKQFYKQASRMFFDSKEEALKKLKMISKEKTKELRLIEKSLRGSAVFLSESEGIQAYKPQVYGVWKSDKDSK